MPQSSIDPVVTNNLRRILSQRARTPYSVARAMGRSDNWIYRVLNRHSGLLLPTLRDLAAELGVSVSSLVEPPEPPAQNGVDPWAAPASGENVKGTSVVELPLLGSGCEAPRGVPFSRDLLDRIGVDPERCQLLKVEDRGMQPRLGEGDLALVDPAQCDLADGQVFAMRLPEGLVVRRAGWNGEVGWLLFGDDPEESPRAWNGQTMEVVGLT